MSWIYDRRLFKEEFLKLINKIPYKFEITNSYLSNIITEWRKKSNRFNKSCVFDNIYDYNNRLILRELRTTYIKIKTKNKYKNLNILYR